MGDRLDGACMSATLTSGIFFSSKKNQLCHTNDDENIFYKSDPLIAVGLIGSFVIIKAAALHKIFINFLYNIFLLFNIFK